MIRSYESRFDRLDAPSVKADANYLQPFDANTLASALRLSPAALWFFVLKAQRLYERKEIPKKSGGVRVLHIPEHRLMRAQKRVLRAFLNRVEYPPWVSAYVPGRAPMGAATIHAGRPALIVVDLKDFFPSTRRAWVRDAFEAEFGLSKHVSQLLASLVTAPWDLSQNKHYVLPQGAPTSGAVANIVAMHRLDPGVRRVCARYGMDYTRYADDLAFSRPEPISRPETEAFIYEIIGAIRRSKYRVNYDKIRVQRQGHQQRLLGMSINSHPNLPKKTYRSFRALIHQCSVRGYEQVALEQGFECAGQLEAYVEGMFAYAGTLTPQRVAALRAQLERGVSVPVGDPDCAGEDRAEATLQG